MNLHRANSILAGVLLLASSLSAQAVSSEAQLLGTWVAVHRSLGGLGSMYTFLPNGKLEMSVGAIVEGWYRIEGDKLILPPTTTSGRPTVTPFRVEGDTLVEQETCYVRVGKATPGAAPIVGVWRSESQATAASIMEQQRKAGAAVDEKTAQAMADMYNHRFYEYTRDGLIKLRLSMRTTFGSYDRRSQTFTLEGEAKHGGRFRLENGLLVLTLPDGKGEDRFIRANATKEELKRSGVRYGDKAAEFDPPVR